MENIDPFVFVLLFAGVVGVGTLIAVEVGSRRFDRKFPRNTQPRD